MALARSYASATIGQGETIHGLKEKVAFMIANLGSSQE